MSVLSRTLQRVGACWAAFGRDRRGAVTIDWVALTAGILLLGIMVVYAIFNEGVSGLVGSINSELQITIDVDEGSAPAINS